MGIKPDKNPARFKDKLKYPEKKEIKNKVSNWPFKKILRYQIWPSSARNLPSVNMYGLR